MSESCVIFIQGDWDDVISKPRGSAWISFKKHGATNQEHGKIENISCTLGNPKLSVTGEFSADLRGHGVIEVKHKSTNTSAVFVAPSKIYTDIHKKSVPCLDVTSGGLCVSFGTENNLIVWDFNRGELKFKLEGHIGDVYRCKFFPSEKVILTGGSDMQLKIWCAETGRCPVSLKGHQRAVTDFAIVDVGRNVISVSKDGSVKLWDCGESNCLDTIMRVPSDINCCAMTSVPSSFPIDEPEKPPSEREIGTRNKLLLIGCEDGTVHCVSVYSRKKLFTLVLKSPVNSVAFFVKPNETQHENSFVVGCQNGEISVYDLYKPKDPVKVVWDLNSPVLDILPFKTYGFFVSHGDGSVYFLNANNLEKLFYLTGPDFDPVYEMSTDGYFLYTSCRDSVIRRYSINRCITLHNLLESEG